MAKLDRMTELAVACPNAMEVDKGSASGRTMMTDCFSHWRSLLLAGTFAILIATALPTAAQMSPLDKSAPEKSNQDNNLKPHATPSTVTPTEKIPVDKIKL